MNQDFEIRYDGPALSEGRMDVMELAPTLQAVGALFREANAMLNQGKANVRVEVRAEMRAGSFTVHLDLIQAVSQYASGLLLAHDIYSASDLVRLVLGTAGSVATKEGLKAGLLGLVKRLKGKKLKRTSRITPEFVEIETDDEKIIVEQPLMRLYRERSVRTQVDRIVSPLDREGYDKFAARTPGGLVQVHKGEREWFLPPDEPMPVMLLTEGEALPIRPNKVRVTVEKMWLDANPKHKWKFRDERGTFEAFVEDEHFLREVAEGRIVIRGADSLLVELATDLVETGGRSRRLYRVLRVLQRDQLPPKKAD